MGSLACRIVICDDQSGFREVLAIALGLEEGLEVVGQAEDGISVVEVVASADPDVVLLDVAMPQRDGIEALPHIRAASPASAIVMLTGFGSQTVRQRALDAGADGFLEKGGELDELVERIRKICAAR